MTGSFPHQAAGLFTVYGNVAADSFVASTSVWTSNLAVTNEGYINRLTAQEVSATSFVNTSTRALKTDINYMSASSTEAVLGKVRGLKVATYRYAAEAGSNPLRLGLIAEDARETAPEILSIDGNGVDLYKLATLTLAGVQTLAEKVDRAEVRLTSLEARLAALESGAVSSASGSPVSFSTTSLASAFNAFGAYIAKGIAQFGTLVADQFVAATNSAGTSSAGTVKIIAGNTVAEVQNAYVKPSTKIFVTFTASTTGSWYIAEKKDGSFRLVLESPQAGDTSFDYFLIQTEGQMATSTPESQISNSQFSISNSNTSTQWITVLGDNPYLIEVGGNFVDPGIDAGGAPVTTYINGVESEVGPGTIDTSSETTYIITYRVLGPNGSIMATRSVIVGNGSVVAGTTSQESQVTSQESSATPESEVISPDSDSQPPIVTLNGEAAMQISEGQTFTDPGATATDETDGDLTAKIATSGSADTATAGSYTLTYSATDAAGNTGSVSRLVTVIEPLSAATETSTTPQ
ncbi:DUF5011 domain-containing protein [Candidatus Kaiserbacteria bacterium]|nr:DUF5011 domain-containing protein [Candidatus Kaiserbacteria bacterium]